MAETTTVQVLRNGPYIVKGPVQLVDAQGKAGRDEGTRPSPLQVRALHHQTVLRRFASGRQLPGLRRP